MLSTPAAAFSQKVILRFFNHRNNQSTNLRVPFHDCVCTCELDNICGILNDFFRLQAEKCNSATVLLLLPVLPYARFNLDWPTPVAGEADSVSSMSASACHTGGPI